jgi:hypothetical protein
MPNHLGQYVSRAEAEKETLVTFLRVVHASLDTETGQEETSWVRSTTAVCNVS